MAKRPPARNPKPRGPSRQAPPTENQALPMCENCGRRRSTKWRGGRWVCLTCRPTDDPDPACTHSLTSVVDDLVVCAYCGGVVKENA
jgi:hypothetical protein